MSGKCLEISIVATILLLNRSLRNYCPRSAPCDETIDVHGSPADLLLFLVGLPGPHRCCIATTLFIPRSMLSCRTLYYERKI